MRGGLPNYVHLGPVALRVSRKHLARWGFPLIRIGGLSLLDRDNCGLFMPASYHPRWSITWLWSTRLYREKGLALLKSRRSLRFANYNSSGWREFVLPFRWVLHLSWQKAMPYGRERGADA